MRKAMKDLWGREPLLAARRRLDRRGGAAAEAPGSGFGAFRICAARQRHAFTQREAAPAELVSGASRRWFASSSISNSMEDRIIAYGGQAVIEGVMMRGRRAMAIAMRAPDGRIVVH